MNKLSKTQKIYKDTGKAIYAGWNSYQLLIGKLEVVDRKLFFSDLLNFFNEAISAGKIVEGNYSKEVIDQFNLNFLKQVTNQEEILLYYNQLAEFLNLYFNHLFFAQRTIKSYNIRFRYLITETEGRDYNSLCDLYIKYFPAELHFKEPSQYTFQEWSSDAKQFAQEAKVIISLVNEMGIKFELKSDLQKIFLELAFIYKYHNQYYKNLVRALKMIFVFETLHIYQDKTLETTFVELKEIFHCSINNIKKIINTYRIEHLTSKVTPPLTSEIKHAEKLFIKKLKF